MIVGVPACTRAAAGSSSSPRTWTTACSRSARRWRPGRGGRGGRAAHRPRLRPRLGRAGRRLGPPRRLRDRGRVGAGAARGGSAGVRRRSARRRCGSRSGASTTNGTATTPRSGTPSSAVADAELVLLPGLPLTHPDHAWLARTSRRRARSPRRPLRRAAVHAPRGRPAARAGPSRRERRVRAGPLDAARPAREVAGDPLLPLAAPPARDAAKPPGRPASLRPRPRVGRVGAGTCVRAHDPSDRLASRSGGVPWESGSAAGCPGGVTAARRAAEARRAARSPHPATRRWPAVRWRRSSSSRRPATGRRRSSSPCRF